jgi:hypothetical protein
MHRDMKVYEEVGADAVGLAISSSILFALEKQRPYPNSQRNHCIGHSESLSTLHEQTPWPLVRERTIPTERPPRVDEM